MRNDMNQHTSDHGAHTPGPWTAKIVDGKAHIVNIYGRGDVIATAYRHLGSPTLMDRDGEGEANARLIAAAPMLLSTLKLAEDCLTMPWVEEHLTSNGMPTDLMLALNNIRAAIRAARGDKS